MKRHTKLLLIGLLSALLMTFSSHGLAQAQSAGAGASSAEVPAELSPEAMQALVSKLDDKQEAALIELVSLINAAADNRQVVAEAQRQGIAEIVKGWVTGFQANVKTHLRLFPEMIASLGKALGVIFQGRETGGNLTFLLLLAAVIVAGVAAEWLFNRIFARQREEIRQSRPEALMDTLGVLSKRAGIEIGGVIVFAAVALLIADLVVGTEYDLFLISGFILSVVLLVRLVGSILHFVLAPRRPELRLVYTDTWTARFIERNFIVITALAGTGFFLSAVMQENAIAHVDTLRFYLGLMLHVWLMVVILKARRGLTQIIEGRDENLTPGLRKMAAWWPKVSAAFVGFNWIFLQFVLSTGHQELSPERSASAIGLIAIAPFLDTIVRGIAAHLVPTGDGKDEVVAKAYDETRHSYIRIGRVILIAILVMAVGKLWGVSLRNLAEAGFGANVAANAVGFLLILALGYLAWEITNLMISRRLAAETPAGEAVVEGGGAGLSRLATVLPIIRMTLQATIIILTVLLALSQLGVNITPLLAGAGVLGLAIGFGAQTLVKDVVSGVFFLLDDAFRVGEFISVGNTMGIVSKISVRSLHLRQDTGPIHIIPYGSMSQLTNNSRDWVTMKLRFTVPFDTDQEKVRKLFKKIGQDMMEVPELAEVLINPFKSQGAADVTDVGIVIRGKFTTVPGGQFLIRKEVYSRVQKAFEENGIEFARKEVRVRLPENVRAKDLSEEQKEAIAGAASEAAEPPAKPQ